MEKHILLTFFFAMSLSTIFATDETERMKLADGLHARGMHKLAVAEYKQLLLDFPDIDKADVILFRLAESLRLVGDSEEADRYFRELYIKHSKSAYRDRAGFRRAGIHKLAGRLDNAITLYMLMVEESKDPAIKAASLFYLGEIYLEQKKGQEAVAVFERIRSHHADSDFYAYALLKLGDIYSENEADLKKAYAAFKTVADNPTSDRIGAEATFQTAELYYGSKDYKNSADFYSRLLLKYPNDKRSEEARIQAAWSQYHASLYADALKLAEDELKRSGDSEARPEWLYLRANCERQLLKNDAASKTYALLIEKYPESSFVSSARYEMALSRYRAGDYQKAVAVGGELISAESGKALSPDLRKDIYWLLAESHAALKQDDSAVQYYRLIAKDYPNSDVACDATYRLAFHLQARKMYLEASRNYISLVDNFPKSDLAPKALYASGICLLHLGREQDALRDWTDLLSRYPKHDLAEETLYRKAVSEIRLSRADIAIETLGRLLKEFPQSKYAGEAHCWRGALFKDGDKLEDAEQEFRMALDKLGSKELEHNAQFFLAVVLHKQDKTDESAKLFSSLIGTSAEEKFTSELLEWLSGYWFNTGDFPKARNCAKVLVERFPEDHHQQTGLVLAGRSYLAEKDDKKAEEAYEKALSISIETDYTAEAALRLGEIRLALGKPDQAIQNFEMAASCNKGKDVDNIRAYAYAGLAKSAKAKGKMDIAAKYYMSVAILYEDEELVAECLFEAVKAFRVQGQAEDADKAMNELERRYPNSPYMAQLKGQI